MNQSFESLPREKRKKILLICDDIRVHSGVATVAKEIDKENLEKLKDFDTWKEWKNRQQ